MAGLNGHAGPVTGRIARWARDTAPEDFAARERDLEMIRRARARKPRRRRPAGHTESVMLLGAILLIALLCLVHALWIWSLP